MQRRVTSLSIMKNREGDIELIKRAIAARSYDYASFSEFVMKAAAEKAKRILTWDKMNRQKKRKKAIPDIVK